MDDSNAGSSAGESIVYNSKARLFKMMANPGDQAGAGAWVEEGQGSLKMYASAQTGRYRMVMTKDSSSSDASRKQLLNQFVHWESTLMPAASEDGSASRAFVWEGEDHSAGASAGRMQTYAIRFKQPALAAEFAEVYKKAQLANERLAVPSLPSAADPTPDAAGASSSSSSGGADPARSDYAEAAKGSSAASSTAAASSAPAGAAAAAAAAASPKAAAGSALLLPVAVVAGVALVGAAALFLAPEPHRGRFRDALKAAQGAVTKSLQGASSALTGLLAAKK